MRPTSNPTPWTIAATLILGSTATAQVSTPAPVAEAARTAEKPRTVPHGSGRWGTIRGRVVYGGDPPVVKPLFDPRAEEPPRPKSRPTLQAGRAGRPTERRIFSGRGAIPSERLVVDPTTRGVRDAIVFLVRPGSVSDRAAAASPKVRWFVGDRGVYVPHAMALMEGTEVYIRTDDPMTYQFLAQIPGTELTLTMDFMSGTGERIDSSSTYHSYENGQTNFYFGDWGAARYTSILRARAGRDQPGFVHSEIHPWMKSWWLVLDHPYSAVTDERGEFTIEGVPAGARTLAVWHESGEGGRRIDRGVEVIADGVASAEVVLDPAVFRPE